MTMDDKDECCPKFDPSSYTSDDGNKSYKEITWNEKPFVKDGTWCFYYVPLAFGRAMTRALKKIQNAEAEVEPRSELMVLSDCHSPWYSNIFLSVAEDKEVEGAEVEKISGTFLAKSFEGDYSNMGKWIKEMETLLKETATKDLKSFYLYYPTCPKCAKKYGENYVVIMADVS